MQKKQTVSVHFCYGSVVHLGCDPEQECHYLHCENLKSHTGFPCYPMVSWAHFRCFVLFDKSDFSIL